ncbi:MAG: manganese efflux pump [Halobacteriovoraceae bacterium]|nr:manganese efflux pump [Halobacteriovoraceae bacterium]
MSNIFEILIIGLVLSADSFSAALAMGAREHKAKDSIKFAFTSGGAEALVAFLGAIAGLKVVSEFKSFGHWISFCLLSVVAIHLAYEGIQEYRGRAQEEYKKEFHNYFKILIVSFATSLDAFAVGVGLGLTGKPIAPYVISIGLWAFISTIIGMNIAKVVSKKLGSFFTLVGSIVLFMLALNFLFQGI